MLKNASNLSKYLQPFAVFSCGNTNPEIPRKVELTDSGKFIEVEREEAIDNLELDSPDTTTMESIDENKPEQHVSTPHASPAKSVRIKENGAKTNGGADAVWFLH